jgi:hypothetical protein
MLDIIDHRMILNQWRVLLMFYFFLNIIKIILRKTVSFESSLTLIDYIILYSTLNKCSIFICEIHLLNYSFISWKWEILVYLLIQSSTDNERWLIVRTLILYRYTTVLICLSHSWLYVYAWHTNLSSLKKIKSHTEMGGTMS